MARTAPTFRRDYLSSPGWTLASDVVYSGSLAVDVWKPNTSGRPVLCLVHGGAWVGGDKAESTTVSNAQRFADLGFCVFSANYTLNPADPATPVGEIKDLVTWLRANAATYNGLTNKVALLGRSAGGHLSLMAATTGVAGGTRPDAVVAWSAPCDLRTLTDAGATAAGNYMNVAPSGNEAAYDALSPTRTITSSCCPLRIVGSSNEDTTTDGIAQAQFDGFVAACATAGFANVTEKIYSGTIHSDFGRISQQGTGVDDVLLTAAWLRTWMPWTVPTLVRTASSGRSASSGRAAA
jgi:acetyl esterase/lipase